MKKVLLTIGATIVVAITSQGQTNAPASLVGVEASTNWVVVPYGIYDLTTHKWGYGGAALYKVTDYFYTGVRAESINGQTTTAGVQAQLQATINIASFGVTPFMVASTGLGKNSLYSSTGGGAYIKLFQKGFRANNHDFTFNIGLAGDYEYAVFSSGLHTREVKGGPLLQLSF